MGKLEYEEAIKELEGIGIVPSNSEVKVVETKVKNPVLEEMSIKTGVKYSEEQESILDYKGNMVILACAGSGKTTISTHLLAKRVKTGEIRDVNKLLCTTYSRAGVKEMDERVKKLFKSLNLTGEIEVKTMHAFFLKLVTIFGLGYMKVLSKDSERNAIIKSACKEAEFVCKDDDLMKISSLLSFQVNNLLNNADTVASYVCTVDGLTLDKYSIIRKQYDMKKAELNMIDYDDMQLYLYKWLCMDTKSTNANVKRNGIAVRDYCRAMYDDFFVDEAQDICKIQYEILKAIIINPDNGKVDKSLIFVGDDDQSIYKWRGAEPEIILTVGAILDIKTFVLSTNYRCKSNIVDFAARSVVLNNYRYKKSTKAYNDGGKVSLIRSRTDDLYEMSILAREVIKGYLADGCKPSDIAVLCRNNFHPAILGNLLVDDGIYSKSTNEVKLTNSYMYKDLRGLMNLCCGTYDASLTEQILWKLVTFLGLKGAYRIASFQRSVGLTFQQTIKYILNEFTDYTVNNPVNLNVNYRVKESLRYSMQGLKEESLSYLAAIDMALENPTKEEAFNNMCYIYLNGTTFLYKNEDKARSIKGLVRYMKKVVEDKGMKGAREYFKVVEQLEKGNMEVIGSRIELSTIHGAKGKEWKHVILFGADNISMPSLSSIAQMQSEEMSMSDINKYIDEERRLYYVGCTRAKDTLDIITTVKPSIFVLESLGMFNELDGSNNDTVLQLVENSCDYRPYMNELEKFFKADSPYYREINSDGVLRAEGN